MIVDSKILCSSFVLDAPLQQKPALSTLLGLCPQSPAKHELLYAHNLSVQSQLSRSAPAL